ncbi:MAG: SET domain-containing protein, partial [Nitrososphaerota archaeon]|nr:SET domain-containing protein [Nitrososphaerota archaeon]
GRVEVRTCPHGRGVFAGRKFAEGSVIRRFDGLAIVPRPSSAPHGRYALKIGEDEYWDGFPRRSEDYWSNFIDHSDDPNAAFVFDPWKTTAWLNATREVRRGEEIFIRYDSYHPTNPRFRG